MGTPTDQLRDSAQKRQMIAMRPLIPYPIAGFGNSYKSGKSDGVVSSQNLPDHFSMHIRQTEIPSRISIGQLFMVKPEQV